MFSEELEKISWDETTERINAKTDADVRRALAKEHCDVEDFMALVSPSAAPYLEIMARLSRKYTEERFGKTISMFIPLYLTNSCTNSCVYCGFHISNPMRRTILTEEEIVNEYKAIKKLAPFENLLMVTGENPAKAGVPYLARALDLAKPYFSNLKIEVMPLKAEEYAELKGHGMNGVICFQETYNKAYNDFSQFIATNNTLEKMVANAEDAGYRLLERNDLQSREHGIGGIRDTKEALRWAFSAEPGEVSGLFECGDNDHMLMVGVSAVIPEGYRPLALVQNQLRFELMRDKKAEKIMADMQAAGASSLDQYKGMANAVSDSVKMVTFAAPAYVPSLRSSEPLVGAYASASELNQLSQPIKGNGGVFVLQTYAKDKSKEEYNEETEMQTLSSLHARLSTQLLNDLYLKAGVKDLRYLFF